MNERRIPQHEHVRQRESIDDVLQTIGDARDRWTVHDMKNFVQRANGARNRWVSTTNDFCDIVAHSQYGMVVFTETDEGWEPYERVRSYFYGDLGEFVVDTLDDDGREITILFAEASSYDEELYGEVCRIPLVIEGDNEAWVSLSHLPRLGVTHDVARSAGIPTRELTARDYDEDAAAWGLARGAAEHLLSFNGAKFATSFTEEVAEYVQNGIVSSESQLTMALNMTRYHNERAGKLYTVDFTGSAELLQDGCRAGSVHINADDVGELVLVGFDVCNSEDGSPLVEFYMSSGYGEKSSVYVASSQDASFMLDASEE